MLVGKDQRLDFKCQPTTMKPMTDQEIGKLTNYIHNEAVIKTLQRKGVHYLFPIQYRTYKDILMGRDMMGRDQTGSGKTLAYVLPMLNRFRQQGVLGQNNPNPRFVVILPTRELALQVEEEINSLKVYENEYKVGLLIGQTPFRQQFRMLEIGLDIIVATPGRLLDHMGRNSIKLQEMQMFCLDEADEMLDMGFQGDIKRILAFIRTERERKFQRQNRLSEYHNIQILMFSATFSPQIRKIAQQFFNGKYARIDLLEGKPLKVPSGINHIAIEYYQPRSPADFSKFIAQLIKVFAGQNGSIMIFCERKSQADEFYYSLQIGQVKGIIHGDIPQLDRSKTFRGFKTGSIKCLISTNVSARGLDFPSVDLVIQLEPPKKPDHYVHRCGRTGRAGRKGTSITLWTQKDAWKMSQIRGQARINFDQLDANDVWNYGSMEQEGHSSKPKYVEKVSQPLLQENLGNNWILDLALNEPQLGVFEQMKQESAINQEERQNHAGQNIQKNGLVQGEAKKEEAISKYKNQQTQQNGSGKEPLHENQTVGQRVQAQSDDKEVAQQSSLLIDEALKNSLVKRLKQLDQASFQKYKNIAKKIKCELGEECVAYFVAYLVNKQQLT